MRATAAATDAPTRFTKRVTGRALLLSAVVIVLVISLAYPLQRYLAQRAEIAALTAANEAAQDRVEELRGDLDRLDDPDYIEQLAHERLQYVMPGDLIYVLVDGRVQEVAGVPAPEPDPEPVPWYERVLDSVGTADQAG